MPFISVIIACHNAGPYIGRAIKSVIDQTFTDFELIVVDDYSTDESLEVVEKFARLDQRIKVHSTEANLGAGPARNIAIKIASGKWLAVLDADDVFVREKLQKQVALIRSAKDSLVLVGTGFFQIDANGRRFSAYRYPITSAALKTRLIRLQAFPPHSSLMYRASTVHILDGFNALFQRAEDYEFLLRIINTGEFACISEPLVEYRHHSTNKSNSPGKAGYSQLDYAIAAKVCYLLRQRGTIDPSSTGDPILWDEFMRHVAKEIKASGELDYQQWKRRWRDPNQSIEGCVAKIRSVLLNLPSNPAYTWRLIKDHTLGNCLPQKCLASWLGQSSCAAS